MTRRDGAVPADAAGQDGRTPTHLAAAAGRAALMGRLAAAGAAIDDPLSAIDALDRWGGEGGGFAGGVPPTTR